MTACASEYIEPTEGARAQIRFLSFLNSNIGVMVYTFDSENCSGRKRVATLTGVAVDHNRKKMELPLGEGIPDIAFTETFIPANKPFTFDMSWNAGNISTKHKKCNITLTFDPKENHIYEASFRIEFDRCVTVLYEIGKYKGDTFSHLREDTVRRGCQ
jgi:hypothetical protein